MQNTRGFGHLGSVIPSPSQSIEDYEKNFFPNKAQAQSEDCRNFILGLCYRGNLCTRRHPRHSLINGRQVAFIKDCKVHDTMAKRNNVCQTYKNGKCRYGLQCYYIHPVSIEDWSPAGVFIQKRETTSLDKQNEGSVNHRRSSSSTFVNDDINWELRGDLASWEELPSDHKSLSFKTSVVSGYGEHLNGPARNSSRDAPFGLDPPGHPNAAHLASRSITLFEHIKVTFRDGFEVETVTTGFESSYLSLFNIPSSATTEQVAALARSYGEFLRIRFAEIPHHGKRTVHITYHDAKSARESYAKFSSTTLMGQQVIASHPISELEGKNVALQDSVVRVQWQAPGRTAYAGYSGMGQVIQALEVASTPYKEHTFKASLYNNIPAVGLFTVKFDHLPPSANDSFMQRFAKPEGIMWEPANYENRQAAINGIHRLLEETEGLVSFDVQSSALPNGMLQGWAQFSHATQAKIAASNVNFRKPRFTGRTHVFANYYLNVLFNLSRDSFDHAQVDLFDFKGLVSRRRDGSAVFFVYKENAVVVRITAANTKMLALLKSQFEDILRGDTVRSGKEVVWDRYFFSPHGTDFIGNAEAQEGSRIVVDRQKRCIRVFGDYFSRRRTTSAIVDKFEALRAQRLRVIPLDRHFAHVLKSRDLIELQRAHGSDSIVVNWPKRCIRVRGSDSLYEVVLAAVRKVEANSECSPSVDSHQPGNSCPMCFNVIKTRVVLPCGHASCRTCMVEYMDSSANTHSFPLICFGDEGSCKKPVPIGIAQKLLSANGFEALAAASLLKYVESQADSFHYCPTPDCPQFYRSVPRFGSTGTVIQCPSCLEKICPSCNVKDHEGLSCAYLRANRKGFQQEFEDWMLENAVKKCPGCAVPIEKAEGCHHVVCTRCDTHVCWVCLQTFPRGEGIYAHMSQDHGGWYE